MRSLRRQHSTSKWEQGLSHCFALDLKPIRCTPDQTKWWLSHACAIILSRNGAHPGYSKTLYRQDLLKVSHVFMRSTKEGQSLYTVFQEAVEYHATGSVNPHVTRSVSFRECFTLARAKTIYSAERALCNCCCHPYSLSLCSVTTPASRKSPGGILLSFHHLMKILWRCGSRVSVFFFQHCYLCYYFLFFMAPDSFCSVRLSSSSIITGCLVFGLRISIWWLLLWVNSRVVFDLYF